MNAWWLLLGTLGYNLHRDRRGLSTICSVTRRHLTWRRFLIAWVVFSAVMLKHIRDGYEPRGVAPPPAGHAAPHN